MWDRETALAHQLTQTVDNARQMPHNQQVAVLRHIQQAPLDEDPLSQKKGDQVPDEYWSEEQGWQRPGTSKHLLVPKANEGYTQKLSVAHDSWEDAKKNSSGKFDKRQIIPLTEWLLANSDEPYPSVQDKIELAKKSGLSPQQVQNWFINMRKRHWTPIMKGKRKPRTFLDYVIKAALDRQQVSKEM